MEGTGNVPKSVTVYWESIPALCRQQGLVLREELGNSGCKSARPAVPAMVLCFCTTQSWGLAGSADARGCCLFLLALNSPCEECGQWPDDLECCGIRVGVGSIRCCLWIRLGADSWRGSCCQFPRGHPVPTEQLLSGAI